MDGLKDFRQSLAETIAWCGSRADPQDPETCLRTPALHPGLLARRTRQVHDVLSIRALLLRERERPADSWEDRRQPAPPPATDLAGGRLLLYAPDETLSDGAAAVASKGFFDGNNVPPWDTWVFYVLDDLDRFPQKQANLAAARPGRWSHEPPLPGVVPWAQPPYYVLRAPVPARTEYVIAWVPPHLIPFAHSGIIVNPESCIEWLADRETPFSTTLQAAGLLV